MKTHLLFPLLLLLATLGTKAEGGKSQIPLADPYILLDNGKYYAYGTHDASGIRCYSSDDLRAWKDEGQALNKANTTETQWFWAPEVYHVGDKYIMYYSANEHLFAATSSSPKGPFVQVGGYQMQDLLGDEKCIDSHIFFDDNGKAYIFFVRFTDGNCIWQAQLEDDCITPIASTLRKCFAASQTWELKLGRVNEGPNVIKYNKRYYLTYSGNDYRSQDYAVGYAVTTNIATGAWTKYSSNPILRRWDDLVGTGHHSFFYDKDGILRIVFHAHESTEQVGTRLMYIGTAQFRSGNLVMLDDPIIRPTLVTTSQNLPYQPELITQSWGFENGGAVTADLNNDGNQDIIAAGSGNTVQNSATDELTSKRMSYLATFAPTTHKWIKVTTAPPFQVADAPSLVPCDINNDGYMDILAFEQTGWDTTEEAYTGGYGCEGFFLGMADKKFTEAHPLLLDTDGNPVTLDMRAPTNAEVIDIDNDGRLDVILVGHQDDTNCNVILHNQSADAANLTFTVEPFEPDFLLRKAIIQPADFNNDGWQDFIISALVDGRDDQTLFTDIYLNEAGHFTRMGIGEKGATVKRKANGALVVADFNDDGWLDFMLSGLGEKSSGESSVRQRLYLNQQTEVPSFAIKTCDIQSDLYTLASSASNAAGVIDWNGDGYYDLMLGGTKGGTYSGTLYLNDGTGRLKRSATIPGATGASIIFPDYNGDGRKDFLLCGLSKDKNYLTTEQQGRNAILCCNLGLIPSRPDAPVAPVSHVHDGMVTLSWEAPETAHAGYTYEVCIQDASGQMLSSTPAIVGGTKDGTRKVNRLGRIGCRTQWDFRPTAPGTYSWSVQTVDATFTGSTFTSGGTFTVTEQDIGSAIGSPCASGSPAAVRWYNLSGQRVGAPQHGLTIMQQAGTARISVR